MFKRARPLHRTAPLKASKPLAPGAPPKRKTQMKPINRARRAVRFERAYHSPAYVAFIRSLSCAVATCDHPAECMHVRSRAAGGRWDEIAGVCHLHHMEAHAIGLQTWQHRFGMDLANIAHATALRWLAFAKES